MAVYDYATHNRVWTYMLVDGKVVGAVHQPKPGLYRAGLYAKHLPLAKVLAAPSKLSLIDRNFKTRNQAQFALRTAFEHAVEIVTNKMKKETPGESPASTPHEAG